MQRPAHFARRMLDERWRFVSVTETWDAGSGERRRIAAEPVLFDALTQPMSNTSATANFGREREPEGMRISDALRLWTADAAFRAAAVDADRIIEITPAHGGDTYRLETVKRWPEQLECTMVRLDPQP